MNKITPVRTLSTITTEILTLQSQAQRLVLEYAIEIGRRLHEAKELVPHGGWGDWLKNEVQFSDSSAQNFMRLYDEYGSDQNCLFGAEAKSQTVGNLSYTKALRLLAIPAEEREEFIKEHDVEALSKRQLDQLIKEKQAAEAKAAELEKRVAEAEKASSETISALEKKVLLTTADVKSAAEVVEQLTKENSELKARPVEAIVQRDEAAIQEAIEKEKARADAEAAAAAEKHDAELEQLRAKLEKEAAKAAEAAESAKKAEAATDNLKNKIKTLETQSAMASPEVQTFKVYFDGIQGDFGKMLSLVQSIENTDAETAGKLRAAFAALLDSMRGRIGGAA